MKVGVGYSNKRDAYDSGKTVVKKAIHNGNLDRYDLVLAFCSGQLDNEKFFRGIKEIVGETPVIGGSTVGIITNKDLSYKGSPAGVAVFQFESVEFQISAASNLDKDEKLAGQKLVKELSNIHESKLLLMLYDSVKVPASNKSPPVMNASPPLLEGINSKFPNLPIIGAGVIGDYQFSSTKQFCGSDVCEQSVAAALISGDIDIYYQIMHGCSPVDGIYRKITKMQGSMIYELDGNPIVYIIDELYGTKRWREQHPLNLLTIGVNYGEKYETHEDKYVNRLITGILPDGSGIAIFEPDLEVGMEIQFMLRDSKIMIESAKENAENLMKKIETDGKIPAFGLYIDCAGRTAEFSYTETEEAEEVQKIMNKYNTPLLGFYSGVEVAPILGKNRGLDWTGVLMILAMDKKNDR